MRISLILLYSLFFTKSVISQTSPSSFTTPETLANKKSLSQQEIASLAQRQNLRGFKENKGQMVDENGALIPSVFYNVESPGLTIWVTNTGLTYQFFTIDKKDIAEEYGTSNVDPNGIQEINQTLRWNRVDMILKNATIQKENIINEGDITQGEESYYLGHCPNGVFNVKIYQKITIKNVYAGIDWVLYTSPEGGLKHDFIVHPMAHPDQIKLIYEGNGTMDILQNELRFTTDLGNLSEGGLLCYEQGSNKEIVSAYRATRNTAPTYLSAGNALTDLEHAKSNATQSVFSYEVGVELGDYDKTQVLIIDPQLVWGTLYGGNGARCIDIDPAGNVFIVGSTGSPTFPSFNPGGGAYFQGVTAGSADVSILKFTNDGVILWATHYGGSTNDVGSSLTTDMNGNVFVTGYTESTNFPTFDPGGGAFFQASYNGGLGDFFILKFNNVGVRLWATYCGGNLNDVGSTVTTDANGNVYIVGATVSTNFPTLNPGGGAYFQGTNGSTVSSAAILKLTNAGVLLWATYYGGNASDNGTSITIDVNGNIFITGNTASTNFPIVDPGGGAYFQASMNGVNDAFFVKFNSAGICQWSTYYGGLGNDLSYSVSTDMNGNVFAIGLTLSTDFPTFNPGGGAYFQGTHSGNFDVFMVKFTNFGVRQWATYYGGNATEIIRPFDALDIDACGNVYFVFATASALTTLNSMNCTLDYFDGSQGGGLDQFITKFSNTGILTWGSYIGGIGNDSDCAVAVDPDFNLFTTGTFAGYTNPVVGLPFLDAGTYFDSTFSGGSSEAYVLKFAEPLIISSSSVDNTCVCDGSATVTLNCALPPYTYTWSNGVIETNTLNNTSTITGLCEGNYTVIINSSCVPQDTVHFVISQICFTIDLNTDTLCLGECVDLQATPTDAIGTVTYVWDNGITSTGAGPITVCPTTTTTYTVTATNGGNVSTASTTIVVDPLPIVNFGNDTVLCNGATLVLDTQNPGSSYNWQDGSTNQTFTVSAAGSYWVTVADGLCSYADTIDVSYNSPIVDLGPDVTSCDLALLLDAQNSGSTYLWQDGTTNQTLNTTANGTYWVEVTDANGCSTIDTILLSVASITVNLGNDTLLCDGTSLVLNAQNAGSSYTWQNASTNQTYTVNSTGTYSVTAVDGLCTSGDDINVTFNSPIVDLGADVTSCDLIVTLDAQNNGATYVWQDGSINQTFNTTADGTYWVEVIDANGCSTIDTILLSVASITVNLGNDTLLCDGTSLVLNAQNTGSSYTWQDASTNQTLTVNADGIYWVNVIDGLCSDSDTIGVNFEEVLTSFSFIETTTCSPLQVVFTDLSTGNQGVISQWSWNFGDGLTSTQQHPSHVYTSSDVYEVTLTTINEYACAGSASQFITIAECGCTDPAAINYDPLATLDDSSCTYNYPVVIGPNVLTPNGDEDNDFLEFQLINVTSLELTVLNRWGNVVYEATGTNPKWDGKVNGVVLSEGIYFYQYKATGELGQELFGQGFVHLIN